MLNDKLKNGDTLASQVDKIDKDLLDKNHRERMFGLVKDGLVGALRKFSEKYRSVSGVLHKFPDPWVAISEQNSFKSRDNAGNIQLTFASNPAGQFLADIDLDDHTGIKHAADVLKHKITSKNTNPYDIH
jgi:hypothetical protein